MVTRTITNNYELNTALDMVAISSNTTTAGNVIDVSNSDLGVDFNLFLGLWTDGVYDVEIRHGDLANFSDAVAVPDDQLLGQDPNSTDSPEVQARLTANNTESKIGYRGSKRYVAIYVTSTGVTTGATILGSVILKREVLPVS